MTWVSYAQNCEDVMLMRALGGVAQGFYVDVGANDPRADSVTRAFYERGWRGINLEPVPHWHGALCEDRPRDLNLAVAASDADGTLRLWEIVGTGLSTGDEAYAQRHRAEGREVRALEVPAMRLDRILAEAGVREVHFLKVDVEGAEEAVLRGLDLSRVRPWVVLVEATEPGSRRSAHAGWEPLLTGSGYRMVWFDGLNRFYLADEHAALAAGFDAPPNVFDHFIRYSEWLARREVDALQAALARVSAAAAAPTPAASAAAEVASLRQALAQANARLAEVYASRSWRVAAPLRALAGLARRLLGRPSAPAPVGLPGTQSAAGQTHPAPTPSATPTREALAGSKVDASVDAIAAARSDLGVMARARLEDLTRALERARRET